MSLFKELKRRNVIRVATAYLVVGWLLIQILGIATDSFEAPAWIMKLAITVIVIGFFIALIIAWVYELTPDGIKKEKDIQSDDSITSNTGKKLDYITIVAAIAVAGMFAWQQIGHKELDSLVQDNDVSAVNKAQVIPVKEEGQSRDLKINNKSIAVLPFTNMANNPESEPITVGLHDDLLTHISKISALKVISRTSVLRYKDTHKPIAEIAQELGVANILEGGVQKSGNQIRINVQLIDAKTDEHIWAEVFDRELTANNIFKIQTEISQKIAAALEAELTPQELKIIVKQDTNNLEAYNAYLAGRQLQVNRNSKDLKQARLLFQKATELDPNYALAYVGQADTLNLLTEYSDLPLSEMFALGEPLIVKALELNPLLAEAHTSKANYLIVRRQFQTAEDSFKYALTLNPNYATTYHWYGLLLRNNLNRSEEALELHRKGAQLDPLSPSIQLNIASDLQSLGKYDQALQQMHKVINFAPNFPVATVVLANLYQLKGNFAESVFWRKKAIELDPGNVYVRLGLVDDYLNINDFENAQKESLTIIEMSPNHDGLIFLNAKIADQKGNPAKGVELFSEAIISNPKNIYYKFQFALYSIKTGDIKSAIKQWDVVSANVNWKSFYNDSGFWFLVSNYAWSLKQTGQDEKSTELFNKAFRLVNNLKDKGERYSALFYYYTMQGKTEESALAYKKWIDSDKVSFWWQQRLPYLDEVKKHPVYIQAHKKLMKNLTQQRKKLAELETKD